MDGNDRGGMHESSDRLGGLTIAEAKGICGRNDYQTGVGEETSHFAGATSRGSRAKSRLKTALNSTAIGRRSF